MTPYGELQAASNFSFLCGASHPDELVAAAKKAGLSALALTDRNTLAGIVRAHIAAKAHDLRFIVGCRLELQDGPDLLCYPKDRAAYGRLCRLLTIGKRRAEKGACSLFLSDVYAHSFDQVVIVVPPEVLDETFHQQLKDIASHLQATCYLGASHILNGDDRARLAVLSDLSQKAGVALIATNDVLYHHPDRRPLQDVVTCIRETCRIEEAGFRLEKNAERHIKSPDEMARLFAGYEEALARTGEVQEACQFSLDELRYEYPDEPVPAGTTPQAHLENLTWEGARERYPAGIPKTVIASLHKELALIDQLSYAPYFLTVHDIVRYARTPQPDKGRLDPILCQGRGSAANSVVCFCLGITSVNPLEIDLLFERFISPERNEPPDIDVDFEHERREEVIQYIYDRYGRERAGIAATVISYRSRSAIREVGKVMGLSEDVTAALAGTVWGSGKDAFPDKRLAEAGLNPSDKRLRKTIELASELIGFPRHLSQHVGGFILTRGALSETVPIGNAAMEDRTFIEWDKDDINALGILKIDVLSLGMLTCIRKCFDLLKSHYNIAHTLASIPHNDKATYDMICNADTIGVFQIESRAQMNMLPRLKPRQFYDLVIEVAIVRPGPIQGDMVHPYLHRRSGKEPVIFPSPAPEHGPADELKNVLGKTLGVPLFQEQAMRLAMVAANFTSTELNALRHAMATFRHRGTIGTFEDKMVARMAARGYDEGFARRCFEQIKGFGEYGFPESHSASFALLAYVSSWLKCHHPEVFACGLLNAQPMGFYAPAQIVRDAKAHGCEVRTIDVNASNWDNTLEPTEHQRHAVRLGFRQIDGFREDFAHAIVQARGNGYHDIDDLHVRAGVPVHVLERLAEADALRSLGHDRRQALWQVKALSKAPALPLFAHAETQDAGADTPATLPEMSLPEHVIADYQTLRLSLKAHPMVFLRDHFQAKGARVHGTIPDILNGTQMSVAGLVLVRQRPGTAKGVIFMTLEDETGVANIIVWPKTFEKYRKVVMSGRLLYVRGKLQSHENVIHLVATHLEDHGGLLNALMSGDAPFKGALSNADEVRRPQYPRGGGRHPRNERVMPKSRDFH
jgi:error-prone DNA polymerase